MLRDSDFGMVRVRAFGTYDFKIVDPKTFLREVAGSDHNFRLDEFADTMRSRIVSIFTDAIATAKIPVLDVASRYTELGEALLPLINPAIITKYGLEITSFIVENVSVPPEVEQAIDKRASMAAVGNLNDFVKYQMGKGLEGGAGGAGAAGTAAELAVGFGLAQQMMRDGFMSGHATPTVVVPPVPGSGAAASTGMPELLGPAEAAQALGVSEADVMTVLESGDLKGKKIGSSWRISRAALTAYMSQ
jgi:excisionase family DNA binding protein